MKSIFLLTFMLLLLGSCTEEYPFYDGIGKKAVYISYASLHDIRNTPPSDVMNTGTIFLRDSLLFMVEQKKGIHVFNVSDSANPVNLTFIQIPAVNDFTISGNTMYADNGPNLVTLNISDLYDVGVIHTQLNVFQPIFFPPAYQGYFECADTSKGVVVDWVDAELVTAKCQVN